MTRAANLAEAAGSGFAFRNRIINGAMNFWQRGTSSTGGGGYSADRWRYQRYASSNVAVSQQSSGLSDLPSCLRIGRTNGDTGTNSYWVTTALEAVDSRVFRGNKATLSFWARIGSGYQGKVLSGSPGVTASITYHSGSVEEYLVYNNFITQASVVSNFALSPTTTWQRFTVTSDVLPTSLFQIGVAFGSEGGSSGTAGTNDYFEITGVQLEVGSVATPFEFRPYGTELALCQRYCTNYNSANANGPYTRYTYGECNATTQITGNIYLPVPMRITPSLTTTSTASNYCAYSKAAITAGSAIPAIGPDGATNQTVQVYLNVASGLTQGNAGSIMSNNNNTSYLLFTAEL